MCCSCDEHNGHVLYTGSSVMDTMDMCYTCHLLSLVISSLHSVQSCLCLPRFYKYSVSTVYVSSLAVFPCYILPLPFAIFKSIFLKPLHWWQWWDGYDSVGSIAESFLTRRRLPTVVWAVRGLCAVSKASAGTTMSCTVSPTWWCSIPSIWLARPIGGDVLRLQAVGGGRY